MEIVLAVIALIVLLIVMLLAVLLINAARLRPTDVRDLLPPATIFGDERSVERFQSILQSATVWDDDPEADRSAFDDFVPKLQALYPKIFEVLELIRSSR